jgi:hypothetical protein
VPQQLEVILFAILSVAVFVASHYLLRKAGRRTGQVIVRPTVRPLRPVLTIYYRRKVIKQIQAERKDKGLPPLENLRIL